ncbi:MAG: 4-hydroxy-tetrahydrodipicolinate synthase [Simkaniaceae bacterium]|nr:4-hydroxy-tetrahydrodipicolinate synthase [Simkaniaceae bacterium]
MERIKGLITAMVTPFKKGNLDEAGLETNVAFQIQGGVDALLILGSTGENLMLTPSERKRVMEIVIKTSTVPVIVNTGTSSTLESIERSLEAEALGADALLIVTPPYVKPMSEGIYYHFKSISEAVSIPIIVYNIPSRTGKNIDVATMKKLALLRQVRGVKESSGNLDQAAHVMHDWTLFAGDDALALPLFALGAKGLISVVSNAFPKEMKTLVDACLEGDFKKGRELHYSLLPFFDLVFSETNPIGIKEAMNQLGLPAGAPRMPLMPMQEVGQMEDLLKRYR